MIFIMALNIHLFGHEIKGWDVEDVCGLLTRPQVLCVTQKGSKELDLRKWSETWCRSQLPALKRVEGSCWKL
jgi:hypothetical protein